MSLKSELSECQPSKSVFSIPSLLNLLYLGGDHAFDCKIKAYLSPSREHFNVIAISFALIIL